MPTFSRDATALAAKDAEIRRLELVRLELRESLGERGVRAAHCARIKHREKK